MAEVYHELANVAEIKDIGALTIPRAKVLLDAVQRQRDYSLVQLLRHPVEGVPTHELTDFTERTHPISTKGPT